MKESSSEVIQSLIHFEDKDLWMNLSSDERIARGRWRKGMSQATIRLLLLFIDQCA